MTYTEAAHAKAKAVEDSYQGGSQLKENQPSKVHKKERQEQEEQEAGISFKGLRAQKSDLIGAGETNELSCSFNDLSSQPAHGMQEKTNRCNKTFNSIQQLRGKYRIHRSE